MSLSLFLPLAMALFPCYLNLTWHLQDIYNLELAGSHNVWGFNYSSFLGYIWGSQQLHGKSLFPSTLSFPNWWWINPIRLSPPPNTNSHTPPLLPTNLYNLLITHIHAVKHGPFHKHSSQLYSIATGVKGWGKVNSGLSKMSEVGCFSMGLWGLWAFVATYSPPR
jgi:serine/threonine-protein phosphatase 2A activator